MRGRCTKREAKTEPETDSDQTLSDSESRILRRRRRMRRAERDHSSSSRRPSDVSHGGPFRSNHHDIEYVPATVPRKSMYTRYHEELQRRDSKTRRYCTVSQEPTESMPRRNHTEFQEPVISTSRRFRAQLQEAREYMPKRDHERELIHPKEPVQAAGPEFGDSDMTLWMKYYCRQTKRDGSDSDEESAESLSELIKKMDAEEGGAGSKEGEGQRFKRLRKSSSGMKLRTPPVQDHILGKADIDGTRDDDMKKASAKECSQSEQKQHAQAMTAAVIDSRTPAIQGNPTQPIDWDEVASISPSASSDKDPNDEDYSFGHSDGEESTVSLSDEGDSIEGKLIQRICRLCLSMKEMRSIGLPFAQDPLRLQRSGEREKISKRKEFEDAFSADIGTVWDAIPGAKSRMYEHQQEGFEFMWKNLEGTINLAELNKSNSDIGGCIISHAPGTGKTLLTLMFINAYLKIFPNSRPMIIAPASMLLTWEEEFQKWNMDFPFHNLSHYELTGKERKIPNCPVLTGRLMDKDVNRLVKIYSWMKASSVLGISYNLFENMGREKKKVETGQRSEMYKRVLFKIPSLVIMDEGHTPRNSNSSIWKAVMELQTDRKIILTGTPFQNNFSELFNTLDIVRPWAAHSLLKEKTCEWMLVAKGGEDVPKKSKQEAIQRLKEVISPFVHVHKGHILKRSLPGLKDSVVLLKLPTMQKHLIKMIEKCTSSFEYEYKVALLSTHPSLAVHCKLDDRINMAQVVRSKDDYKAGVKTRFVVELVRLSIDRNEKVLVFSQYQQVHKLMAEQLQAFFKWGEGRQVISLHGKQNLKVRQKLITKFNDPKSEAVVLLASTKCCSEGINLVGASRVVLLDVVWNPSVERQAISRAYRLGQQKVVHTYHLMAEGTTEGDKYCRQVEKDRLSELVFSSTTKENVTEQDPAPLATAVDDGILHSMLGDESFKDMVKKIIYQPKEVKLIESFIH